MGLKEANIILENQWNTFYAGQTVNGRIEYVFDSPKKVRGIYVRFKGEARTDFDKSGQKETAVGISDSTDHERSAKEEYLHQVYYVLGSKTGNETEIPAGKQVYNFSCTLPSELPSSFEGEYGYVRYTVKVTLDRPWKFDQETKMAFTVISAVDLNRNSYYKRPFHIQLEKTFCCFCCTSRPLSVDVQAPVTGYCPGQIIPLTVTVNNSSNVELELVKLILTKVITYKATSPGTETKTTRDALVTLEKGPVPPGVIKIWNLYQMEVPPTPPSDLEYCNIIDVHYYIMAECVVSGMHLDMDDFELISIGTVPLMGLPGQAAFESAQPVYKESAYTASTIQDRGDNAHVAIKGPNNFAPYYPTYAAVQPPPAPLSNYMVQSDAE